MSLLSAAGAAFALLWLALVVHRPDLVALAAPLLAVLTVNLARPPSRGLAGSLGSVARTLFEDQRTTLELLVRVAPEADLVTAVIEAAPWMELSVTGTVSVAPDARTGVAQIAREARAVRWSRTRTGSAQLTASAGQGLLRAGASARSSAIKIIPLRDHFHAVDAFPRASGIVGAHRTRRPGDGSDLEGVRAFLPGDRLKRINWPVSLRTGQLHVTTTVSDRDTAIMIVLDTSIDVTARTDASTGGSLDIAVHAAAAVAEHYLHHGDRVGLLDHARPFHPLRPAAGRRQLDRVIEMLLDVAPRPVSVDVSLAQIISRVAPRATVVLLSPLIGAARADRAAGIARSGHTVLVVDTLGADPPFDVMREWTDLAWRMQLLQRGVDIDNLGRLGVPVVSWHGAGSLDTVLLSLSRSSAQPRVR
jgi:uncharacterized protein (DUF58 family)